MKDAKNRGGEMRKSIGFMLVMARRERRTVPYVCALLAVLTVASTTAEMLLAPMILRVIEGGGSIGRLFQAVGAFTLTLIVVRGAQEYLQKNAIFGRVKVRFAILEMIEEKNATTGYPNLLDTRYNEKYSQASFAVRSNNQATEAIWDTLSGLMANVLGCAVYLALLSGLKWYLAALTAALAVLDYAVNARQGRWSYDHREEEARYKNALGYVTETLDEREFAKDIRIFGLSRWLQEVWERTVRLYDSFNRRELRHLLAGNAVSAALTVLRNGLTYCVLVAMALRGEIGVAEFLLYFSAVTGFTAWVSGIMESILTMHRNCLDIARVRELLDWPEPFRMEGGAPLPEGPYELTLENVSYRYPEAEAETITRLNIVLRPGEKLAVVGLNGAGKTTLIRLITGFLDPTEGRVLLNGRDIREFNRPEYYALFAAVFQEFSVLPATIRENVTQTREGEDEKKMWESMEKAGIADKTRSLSREAESQLTRNVYEDGVELSGGEMQRLMLARVIYSDSPILLLDEPTAALDPLAENDIYQKYNALTVGKTAVFISHRLASTRFCDRILYMENGRVAEEGSHEELLRRGGKYADLFEVQSRYYRKEENEDV